VIAPLFVRSPSLAAGARALVRALDFYGIDAAVLLADTSVDLCGAIEIGARASSAPLLILQSPTCHATSPGWAARLVEALGTGAAAASPTLLYEDWSIRYAGIDGLRFAAQAPYAEAEGQRVGMPRGALTVSAAIPTRAALLDCCVIRRGAFERVDGFSMGFALPATNGLDLFLRLDAAGETLLWTPEIEVYALDDAVAADCYWALTGERVDGWSLRASWQERRSDHDVTASTDIVSAADPSRSKSRTAGRAPYPAVAGHPHPPSLPK
jgi:hypothetical protein